MMVKCWRGCLTSLDIEQGAASERVPKTRGFPFFPIPYCLRKFNTANPRAGFVVL
jgi:hypothetical protein